MASPRFGNPKPWERQPSFSVIQSSITGQACTIAGTDTNAQVSGLWFDRVGVVPR